MMLLFLLFVIIFSLSRKGYPRFRKHAQRPHQPWPLGPTRSAKLSTNLGF